MLTADPECWQCLREAGTVDVFLDMIMLAPHGAGSDDQSVGCHVIRASLNT